MPLRINSAAKRPAFASINRQIKNNIVFTILILCNLYLHAQTDSIQTVELARLQEMLTKTTRIREKVSILNQLSEKQLAYNTEAAMHQASQALNLSRRDKYTGGISRSYVSIGKVYEKMGQPQQALQYFFRSLEYSEPTSDRSLLTITYYKIAQVYYGLHNYAAAIEYYNKIADVNRNRNWRNFAESYINSGNILLEIDSVNSALNAYQRALQYNQYLSISQQIYLNLQAGKIYLALENYSRAYRYFMNSLSYLTPTTDTSLVIRTYNLAGKAAYEMHEYETATKYIQKAIKIGENTPEKILHAKSLGLYGEVLWHTDSTYLSIDYLTKATTLFQENISKENSIDDWKTYAQLLIFLGKNYDTLSYYPKSIESLTQAYEIGKKINSAKIIVNSANELRRVYRMQNIEQDALLFDSLYTNISDTLEKDELQMVLIKAEMQNSFNKEKEIQQLYQEKIDAQKDAELRRQKLIRNFFVLVLAAMVVSVFFAVRGLRRIRKDNLKLSRQQQEILEINDELSQQKEEVMAQAEQIERTNHELERKNDQLQLRNLQLKKSQQQLILQEKLATVGQLTTGIAHEIKNPLNFVNNFSNLTVELTQELRRLLEEMKTTLSEDQLKQLSEILELIDTNVIKIHEHGTRADKIIKGMLRQSREAGEFEVTDFNNLVNEYVNLAYHGERARDKGLTVNIVKELNPSIGNVNMVPHDFGRVVLNLVNNACYALRQRGKLSKDSFSPELRIRSYIEEEMVVLRVRDNAMGLSKAIKSKIFNPFFTTKPAGEGTGLGLSTSYEIITKTHKGKIDVESSEGEFTEFIITIPRNL